MNYRVLLLSLLVFVSACQDKVEPGPQPEPAFHMTEGGVLTNGEVEYHTGLKAAPTGHYGKPFFTVKSSRELPAQFDWEAQGVKTPVRNQGNCGSCWAFASIQTLEGALKRQGKELDLSEQELVGKLFYGCGGGWYAGDHMVSPGVPLEADCPYRASGYKCPAGLPVATKAASYGYVGKPNKKPTVEEIKQALVTYGPLSCTVSAQSGWGSYHGGVFKGCKNGGTNHMVAIVGYDDATQSWKMKNSWGTKWGDQGYMNIAYGCDRICEEAAFAVIEGEPCKPPKAKLPAEVKIYAGEEVTLAVKAENGVTYSWFIDGQTTNSFGPLFTSVWEKDSVVKLVAKNACGELEVETKITIVTQ